MQKRRLRAATRNLDESRVLVVVLYLFATPFPVCFFMEVSLEDQLVPAEPYLRTALVSAALCAARGKSCARNFVSIADGALHLGLPIEDSWEACKSFVVDDPCIVDKLHEPRKRKWLLETGSCGRVSLILDSFALIQLSGVAVARASQRVGAWIGRPTEEIHLPVAVVLAAVVGSYASDWRLTRTGLWCCGTGQTLEVPTNRVGTKLFGTPGDTIEPACWHPLFRRVFGPSVPGCFSELAICKGAQLNPPFLGWIFAEILDAVRDLKKVPVGCRITVPAGWGGSVVGFPLKMCIDELSPDRFSRCIPMREVALDCSGDVKVLREKMLRVAEDSLQEGWGAHLLWAIPVYVLKLSFRLRKGSCPKISPGGLWAVVDGSNRLLLRPTEENSTALPYTWPGRERTVLVLPPLVKAETHWEGVMKK